MDFHNETKTKIKQLKDRLKNDEDPIKVLEDAFEGRTVLVVSAGPSAIDWRNVFESIYTENPVVVCVKQSINLVGSMCDIHFLNNVNLFKYKKNDGLLTVMTDVGLYLPKFGKYDVNYSLINGNRLIDNEKFFLAINKDFDNYTLNKTGIMRPVGPGIMHESVIYTLVHMGFKKIVTVGWDIADDKGVNTHFYDGAKIVVKDDSFYNKKQKIKTIIQALGVLVIAKNFQYVVRYIVGVINFNLGKKVNAATMFNGEAEMTSESMPSLRNWLSSMGVRIDIHSKSKWMK
ncbi:MAG: hypothetical protein R6W78_08760 [Bacteroidales bacterium]